jgi:hypothetical protein
LGDIVARDEMHDVDRSFSSQKQLEGLTGHAL